MFANFSKTHTHTWQWFTDAKQPAVSSSSNNKLYRIDIPTTRKPSHSTPKRASRPREVSGVSGTVGHYNYEAVEIVPADTGPVSYTPARPMIPGKEVEKKEVEVSAEIEHFANQSEERRERIARQFISYQSDPGSIQSPHEHKLTSIANSGETPIKNEKTASRKPPSTFRASSRGKEALKYRETMKIEAAQLMQPPNTAVVLENVDYLTHCNLEDNAQMSTEDSLDMPKFSFSMQPHPRHFVTPNLRFKKLHLDAEVCKIGTRRSPKALQKLANPKPDPKQHARNSQPKLVFYFGRNLKLKMGDVSSSFIPETTWCSDSVYNDSVRGDYRLNKSMSGESKSGLSSYSLASPEMDNGDSKETVAFKVPFTD